jgi:hypothetical protein
LYKNGQTSFKGEIHKAFIDLKNCGLLERISSISKIEEFRAIVITEYISSDEYKYVWDAAKKNGNIVTAVANLIKINMTQSTLNWRVKRIINCGKSLGIIENKRYSYKNE